MKAIALIFLLVPIIGYGQAGHAGRKKYHKISSQEISTPKDSICLRVKMNFNDSLVGEEWNSFIINERRKTVRRCDCSGDPFIMIDMWDTRFPSASGIYFFGAKTEDEFYEWCYKILDILRPQ